MPRVVITNDTFTVYLDRKEWVKLGGAKILSKLRADPTFEMPNKSGHFLGRC